MDGATLTPATASRVLVAEDNEINQLVITRMLMKRGYDVTLVENGAEAYIAMTKTHFDLVIMDCQMPILDGYSAARRIRAELTEPGRSTPIIALTANAMKGDRERCLEAGMDDYLTKPIDTRLFWEIVEKVLTLGRASVIGVTDE